MSFSCNKQIFFQSDFHFFLFRTYAAKFFYCLQRYYITSHQLSSGSKWKKKKTRSLNTKTDTDITLVSRRLFFVFHLPNIILLLYPRQLQISIINKFLLFLLLRVPLLMSIEDWTNDMISYDTCFTTSQLESRWSFWRSNERNEKTKERE